MSRDRATEEERVYLLLVYITTSFATPFLWIFQLLVLFSETCVSIFDILCFFLAIVPTIFGPFFSLLSNL